jgi:NADH-quinone oxidoreductase subunit M
VPVWIWNWSFDSYVFFKVLTGISVVGVVLGAGYFLWSYQKVFQGELNPKYAGLSDMDLREKICLWPLAIIVVALGVYPALYLDAVNPAIEKLSRHMAQAIPWLPVK